MYTRRGRSRKESGLALRGRRSRGWYVNGCKGGGGCTSTMDGMAGIPVRMSWSCCAREGPVEAAAGMGTG